jgi:hypothetical protein
MVQGLVRPFLESLLSGLLIGIADVNNYGPASSTSLAYVLAGIVLGVRHAGRAWPCWLPLGASLYLTHVAAFRYGYRQPYVEASIPAALVTLENVVPAGLGLAIGVGLRLGMAGLGWFRRNAGPPVQLLPRTAMGLIAAIAWIGIALGFMHWVFIDSSTIYAAGYDEARFRQIQIGMTAAQVESMLGPPLHRYNRSSVEIQDWGYTEGASSTSNYWRREVMIEDGKVKAVVSDYWWD